MITELKLKPSIISDKRTGTIIINIVISKYHERRTAPRIDLAALKHLRIIQKRERWVAPPRPALRSTDQPVRGHRTLQTLLFGWPHEVLDQRGKATQLQASNTYVSAAAIARKGRLPNCGYKKSKNHIRLLLAEQGQPLGNPLAGQVLTICFDGSEDKFFRRQVIFARLTVNKTNKGKTKVRPIFYFG